MVLHIDKKSQALNLAFFVPPLGIEPGPSEPESEILSFKLHYYNIIVKI